MPFCHHVDQCNEPFTKCGKFFGLLWMRSESWCGFVISHGFSNAYGCEDRHLGWKADAVAEGASSKDKKSI